MITTSLKFEKHELICELHYITAQNQKFAERHLVSYKMTD